MSFVTIRAYARSALQATQFARNGRYPDYDVQRLMTEEANHLAMMRTKELASFSQSLGSVPSGEADGNDRHRWRFAFHTSPFAKYLWATVVLARNGNSYNPGARLRIETTAPATFGDAEYYYGDSGVTASDVPDELGTGTVTIVSAGAAVPIGANTSYYGTFTDLGSGRLVAATVYESSLLPDTANGYLPVGFSLRSPIYDEDRKDLAAMARSLWKHQAAHLWNWSSDVDDDSPSESANVATNVVDGTSTSVSASTPGATIDLRYRSTVRRGTVPCVFKAYGGLTGGGSGTGAVELKDSSGTVLATITGFTLTEGWLSTTVDLPATLAKYDVHFRKNNAVLGAGIVIRACSLYQYEA